MKRKALFTVIACLLFFLCGYCVSAAENEREYEYVHGEAGTKTISGEREWSDSIAAALPESVSGIMPEAFGDAAGNADGTYTVSAVAGALDADFIFGEAVRMFRDELTAPLRLLSVLLSLVVISALFGALRDTAGAGSIGAAFDLCCGLAASLALYGSVFSALEAAGRVLSDLVAFASALLPVFTSLYAAGGSVASAAVANSALYVFVTFAGAFCGSALFPLARVMLAFSLVGAVSRVDVGGVSKLIGGIYTTALTFTVALCTAVFSFQNSIAAASDSLGLRAVRFAAGSFIPVIGGAMSEALKTVAGSLALIKSTLGWVAAIAVILIILPALISLLLHRVALNIAAAAARLAGCSRESTLFEGAASVFGLCAAALSASGVLFIIAVTLFVKTASVAGI